MKIHEYQARELAFSLGLSGGQIAQMISVLRACYRAYRDLDALMVEINPLVITDAGGAREVVTAPEAGVIVARNCRAVRDGIRLVTENPRTPQAVAATVDDFSWETNGRRLAAYYDSLLR